MNSISLVNKKAILPVFWTYDQLHIDFSSCLSSACTKEKSGATRQGVYRGAHRTNSKGREVNIFSFVKNEKEIIKDTCCKLEFINQLQILYNNEAYMIDDIACYIQIAER